MNYMVDQKRKDIKMDIMNEAILLIGIIVLIMALIYNLFNNEK